MKTLTIILKQHTPLLHFQHDQKGATVRASEIKPKLDRFLIKRIGDGCYETGCNTVREEYSGWIVSEHNALDYRIKCIPNILETPQDPNEFIGTYGGRDKYKKSPMYFANLGAEKKFYSLCDSCELRFYSRNEELISFIKKNIADFFMSTNFGTRQTKGYGSFSVISQDIPKAQPIKLFFTVIGNESKLFEQMEIFHKAIRSGIHDCNGKPFYMKSFLFAYAKKLEQQWEKKTIKLKYYPSILADQIKEHPGSDILLYKEGIFNKNETYFTYRDCLGLSTLESWKNPYTLRTNKKDIKMEKKGTKVARFESPILLKPIKTGKNSYNVYITHTELPEEFKKETFLVTCDGSGDLKLKIDPNFSIGGYFNFLFKRDNKGNYAFNIDDMIAKGSNPEKIEIVQRIFNDLRNNCK